MPKPDHVLLGRTKIALTDLVRDPRGIEDMLVELITNDWSETHYLNFGSKIKPFATATDLADWNHFLLERYPPLYLLRNQVCRDCSSGPCNLAEGNGFCSRSRAVWGALESLRKACRGALSQLVVSRQLLNFALKSWRAEKPVSLGRNITFADAAPSIALLTGLPVKTLADLEKAQSYAEQQLVELFTTALAGQDEATELEARAFQAGSLLFIAMEVAEIIKVACFDFTTAGNEAMEDLEDYPPANTSCGLGTLNPQKPSLVFTGDDFLPAWAAVRYLLEKDFAGQVEIGGIGAVAGDLARFYPEAKVLTTAPRLLKALKAGLVDVLVFSGSCQPVNVLEEAHKQGVKVIATARYQTLGLPDRTDANVSAIVAEILEGVPGAAIFDVEKAGVVAAEVALQYKRCTGVSFHDSVQGLASWVEKCLACTTCRDACFQACPYHLNIREALQESQVTGQASLTRIFTACEFCGQCTQVCPVGIPLEDLFALGAGEAVQADQAVMRAGRGPVPEVEVRAQAFGITFGNSPGLIALIGCGAGGLENEAAEIARELVSINCTVFTAGCLAVDLAKAYDEKKRQFIFQQFGSAALARNLVNCGGCAAQVHIIDEFLKVARLGGAVSHYANLMEAADYIYNRVPYCVILWGVVPERMYSLAAGIAHRGIPVVVGPGINLTFPRFLVGDKYDRDRWISYHGASGEKREVEPAPNHLIVPVETKEEALTMAMKLLMRSSDQRESRLSTIEAYLNFHQKFYGELPDDWPWYVRSDQELPVRTRIKLLNLLKDQYGWEVKNYRIKKARTRDGKLVPIEEYNNYYGIEQGGIANCLVDFVQRRKQEE